MGPYLPFFPSLLSISPNRKPTGSPNTTRSFDLHSGILSTKSWYFFRSLNKRLLNIKFRWTWNFSEFLYNFICSSSGILLKTDTSNVNYSFLNCWGPFFLEWIIQSHIQVFPFKEKGLFIKAKCHMCRVFRGPKRHLI